MSTQKTSYTIGLFLVFVATAAWATVGVWIKLVVEGSGITAIDLAFWRDFIMFLVFAVALGIINPKLLAVRKQDLRWLALMGMAGIGFFHVLWNLSVLLNGAAIATVFQFNSAIVLLLAAWVLWREPLCWQKWLAIVLVMTGTALISLMGLEGGIHVTLTGAAVGLTSALAFSVYVLSGKRLTDIYNPWTVITYVFGFAALGLWPVAFFTGTPWQFSPAVGLAFAAFIFIPTLGGFGLYTVSLRHLPVSVAGIVASTEVPLAALVAYFVLDERLDTWQIVGMVLVVAGVMLVSLQGGKRDRGHM